MGFKGRRILLQVNIGGNFVTVAGIQSRSLNISQETVDITDAESLRWRELQPNMLASIELSGNGVFKNDAAMRYFENANREGLLENCKVIFENGDTVTGEFFVTSFDYGGETLNAQTASLSLSSSGASVLTRG